MAEHCAEFTRVHAVSPFRSISESLTAWHFLALERNKEAETVLKRMCWHKAEDVLGAAAITQARTWLTRIDHAAVKKALSGFYIEALEYPQTLNPLLSIEDPPPTMDRWDLPWMYRIVDFTMLKGFSGQRYELESERLKPRTDLTKALTYSYGGRLQLRPIRYMSRVADKSILEVEMKESTGRTRVMALAIGSTSDNITFAFEGQHCIVLSDGDYWHILPSL